jgi:hypothetical protein
MAWYDSGNGGWYKPEESRNPLPGMQLGAQIRQQVVADALKAKDLELESQRTGIQIQEYFSKKELQNQTMAGSAELAKAISTSLSNGFTPDTPEFQIDIHEVAKRYPMVMQSPAWKGVEAMSRDATKAAEQSAHWQSVLEQKNQQIEAMKAQKAAELALKERFGERGLAAKERGLDIKTDELDWKKAKASSGGEELTGRVWEDPESGDRFVKFGDNAPRRLTRKEESHTEMVDGVEVIRANPVIGSNNEVLGYSFGKKTFRAPQTAIEGKLTDVQKAKVRAIDSEISALLPLVSSPPEMIQSETESAKKRNAAMRKIYDEDKTRFDELKASRQKLLDEAEKKSKPLTSPAGTKLDLNLKPVPETNSNDGWKIELVK